ncbi:MAG TPA: hypothetical protein DET40_18610 [Lentisphaeria bacterium]|nr:MAG: hypothetical protein A2X45_10900 [Lentisphaerae bacterium GWF2_50_93]HCE45557.1 hypothetical protein [Lentisphaeria bacterium]
MITACYIFLVLFMSVMLEVMLGSASVIIPLTGMSLFYLSMVHGWRVGLFLGFFSGIVVDMLFSREIPVSALSFMAVSGVTAFWLLKGETKDVLLHAVPGVLTALVTVLPLILVYWKDMMLCGAGEVSILLLIAMASGAFILPLLILILDFLSEWLGMDLYRNARENIEERI